MKNYLIFYVYDKDITIKQLKTIVLNNIIDTKWIFVLKNDTYKILFENYGNVYIENDYNYVSNCYQQVYSDLSDIIKQSPCKVLEINSNFFVDSKYIVKCINNSNSFLGSGTFITLDNDILYLNQLKNNSTINNVIYCRCFSTIALNDLNYKVFDFNKNDNLFELSQISCLLKINAPTFIPSQHVYKLHDNHDNHDNYNNMFQTILTSEQKKKEINDILDSHIDIYFNQLGIMNVVVSDDIIFFEDKIKNKYNLSSSFESSCEKLLFFGMYSEHDISRLESFSGEKYIIWAGSDIDDRIEQSLSIISRIKSIDAKHYAISKSIEKRLEKHNIPYISLNFSLVNIGLYRSITLNIEKTNNIYVYDGNGNNMIYNCDLCIAIKEKMNSKYNFIFRSEINLNEYEMIDFYQTCFMGIRLCENDGNANTVQEMGLLGLPVLHNGQLPNSVPWIDDMEYICEKIDYIYNNFNDKKEIISDSVLKFINGDEREEMCIFVPMWKRHETTEKNLHLLMQQDYMNTRVVVIHSNIEDEIFCKRLEKQYTNLYPIKVENRPLSKKFQFGAEFCKIFYSYGIIINGSDDFLSLNFATTVYNKFKNSEATYFGCNFWYVGDTVSMLLYKFTYNDPLRVVGCGRSFKHTLLNDMNWQVFPLIKNSGIDGASKDMIKDIAIPYSSNEPYCFTFSFKEKTDMITPMSNLLKSDHSTWQIVGQGNLNQILYANNILELQLAFKLKPTVSVLNRYLFITLLDDNLKKSNPIMLNSYYMESVLSTCFDIMDLRELETRKNFDYSLIFIDGIALNTRTTKLNREKLFKYLAKIKHIPKVLLSHDIHDYSYDFENNCQPVYCDTPLLPVYGDNALKQNFLNFLKINNIEYIIGICDCPELDLFVKFYSSQVKRFYLMTHHIPENIFYYKGIEKEYDILIYGWANEIVYPFRFRLKELIKKLPFRVKIIERSSNITKMPVEHDLAELINKSWIVITCISNFSYLVRKYFEIGACGSIPCGNINEQGRQIFQNSMIEITEQMSDYEIEKIITYYLNNKELLMKMSDEIRSLTMKFNYNAFMKNLLEIKSNIMDDINTDLLYEKQKILYEPHIHNKIYNINNVILLSDWKTNQKASVESVNHCHKVILYQDKSTPGIKTHVSLDVGNYILTFGIETENIKTKVFVFNTKSVQINVNEQTQEKMSCANINILEKGKYNILILATNPYNNASYIVKNSKIKKITLEPLDYTVMPQIHNNMYNNMFVGSMSCVGEVTKLVSTFGTHIIDKDDILKKRYKKITNVHGEKTLILVGFYSPHHWSKYKGLFSLFSKVFIIFTGTDILQLGNEKVKSEDKIEILKFLQQKNTICGALNHRNREEIYSLYDIQSKIISLPISTKMTIFKKNIKCPLKIACYVGNNYEWYCFETIKKVAKILTNYEFYVYKYEGFNIDFIDEHKMENMFYNTSTIIDIEDFMYDKLCSLRITLHDGEPMTGIETILMQKPFLFNHEMKYATLINNDEIDIANTILNLPSWDVEKGRIATEYYKNRNSTKVFERNMKCYVPNLKFCKSLLHNDYMVTVLQDDNVVFELRDDYTIFESNNNVTKILSNLNLITNKKYRIILNGYTDGHAKIDIINGKIFDKVVIIEKFETCSYIDFMALNCTEFHIILKTFDENCRVMIRNLDVYSF